MAKRKFTINEQELGKLRGRMDNCKDGATRMRYQGVWMYAKGYPLAEILEITGCSRTSLMNWCRDYRKGGLEELEDHRLGGNNTKLSRELLAEIQDHLCTYTPEMLFGSQTATLTGEFWTVEDLYRWIQERYGITYQSRTSYQEIFAKCDFSYQRTEKVFKSRRPKQVAEFEELLEKN
jgi:transposase